MRVLIAAVLLASVAILTPAAQESLADSVADLRAMRMRNLRFVRRLSAAELDRVGMHNERGPESVRAVVTDGGRHACDAVVIACGAWSHKLARKLVDFEASPGWLKVPPIAITALKG